MQWWTGSEFFTGHDRFKGGPIGCGLKNKGVVEGKWRCNSSISLASFSYTERLKFILAKRGPLSAKRGPFAGFEGGPPAADQSAIDHVLTICNLIGFRSRSLQKVDCSRTAKAIAAAIDFAC